MTAIQIPASTLTVGTITIDGFTVENTPVVDSFGTVAVRGITRDGAVEKRVWSPGALVPVLA
jgi:hypothetical protein